MVDFPMGAILFPCTVLCLDSRPRWLHGGFGGIHRQKERYQVWFPGAHFGIGYPRRCAGYFEQETQPPFQDNTQLPTEKIGGMRMPLRIDFVAPEEFGFSRLSMKRTIFP